MSDLIRRDDVLETLRENLIEMGGDDFSEMGVHSDDIEAIVKNIPTAEPTIDTIAERIDIATWYHINPNGKLVEGASGREEALYKAEDIFRILEEMGADEDYI